MKKTGKTTFSLEKERQTYRMCVIPVQVLGDIVLIDGVSLETVGEAKACAHLRGEERKLFIVRQSIVTMTDNTHYGHTSGMEFFQIIISDLSITCEVKPFL
ncbi:hypothetical protein U0070_008336 [Myodes glareolus]|uniref:Uncharacterized protein n=1 Tax=Myodes glareolus TaxID=447135 RepID=A0AAW0IY67_MYOGA